jgi:hypothetical protein
MSLLLTADELALLTDTPQPSRQIEWLRSRGWRFEVSVAGRPKVARAYYERRMVAESITPEPPARPRFELMIEHGTKAQR